MSRKRKRILLSASAVIVVVVAVWAAREYARVQRIPGIYLTDGGLGYVKIANDQPDGWRITHSRITLERLSCLSPQSSQVSSVWPRLVLMGKLWGAGGRAGGPTYLVPFDYRDVAVFMRSRSRTDDWDLAKCGVVSPSSQPPPAPSGWIGRLLDKWWPWAKAPEVVPLQSRVPYLHRLDDERVIDCFNLHYRDQDSTGALQRAGELLRSSPNDPYIRTFYLGFAARNGQIEEVAKRLDEWQSDANRPNDPHLRLAHKCLGLWVRANRLTKAGRNGYDFLSRIYSRDLDLPTHLALLPHVLDFDECLNTAILEGFYSPWNFLHQQVMAKNVQVIAVFRMLEGKCDESLRLLASVCRSGQLTMQGANPIESMIGVALVGISSNGLALYDLNCCETEEGFRQLWATLDRLEQGQRLIRPDDLLFLQSPVERLAFESSSYQADVDNFEEFTARVGGCVCKFELVRLATAAKYHFLVTGIFPASDGDLGPLLPNGPPKDPFGDGPLRYFTTSDSLICYSVGPDKQDNRATVEYDPTNGTVSAGDISLKVPRVRQYPFPRGGVRAASLDELKRQFPNGLPADPFATIKNQPLGTTITAEGDVYVFSYGPDVDEFKHVPPGNPQGSFDLKHPPPHTLECPYDPTNGTVSEGDLFIRIPRP